MLAVYAGQYGPTGLEYPDGGHVVLAPVLIQTLGGAAVTLYADRHRVETVPNPAMTDDLGNITFFVEPGKYKMVFSGREIPISVPEDPSEPDVGLTPEDREALIDDAAEEVLADLEPPVNLTLLFENVISQ